jgi:GT2 family glycosyltransferase
MSSIKVTVVVLNWNGGADTIECLESLAPLSAAGHQIVMVDNGSTDGSLEQVRLNFTYVRVIDVGENRGFAGGNNVGIRAAIEDGAEYVLLLNNDTVVAPDLIEELLRVAQTTPDAGVLGPKIYYYAEQDRIWSAGGFWDKKARCFEQLGDGERDEGQFDKICDTEFVVGCAMFVPAQVFRDVGLLDEQFFLNYEEIDFSYRVRCAGYRAIYVPRAKLWHKVSVAFGGEDSPLKDYFIFRNRLLWAKRHLPLRRRIDIHLSVYRIMLRRFFGPAFGGANGVGLRRRYWALGAAFRSPKNRAVVRGLRDYWGGRFGDCPDVVRDWTRKWAEARQATRGEP